MEFDWDLSSLHKQLKELKGLNLVLGMRAGALSGSHPEVLFDQLPLPLLSGDKYVTETFGKYLQGFVLTRIKTGIVSGGRYVSWGTSILPVPTRSVMFADPSQIPQDRHIVVINGQFCITDSLASQHAFYLRCIQLKPVRSAISRSNPKSEDCSHLFAPRERASEADIQGRFNAWLDIVLSQAIPPSVVAFNFNLAEPWSIEVIGSDRYSDSDSDWACEESFRPDVERFLLRGSAASETWKSVLNTAKPLISAYLDRPSGGSAILRGAEAVVVGFVDGDLHKIWPRGRGRTKRSA